MLFITRDWNDEHEELIRSMNMGDLRSRIYVQPAEREEVSTFLGASDIMLSFIKPTFSKIASSPTKLAEAFAMGIPVISNTGVGDVERITQELDAGAVFDLSDKVALDQTVHKLKYICSLGGSRLRESARPIFGLEEAEKMYRSAYSFIEHAK
jgi:glycosyltransferase involved in cell wall biosynthesis